MSAGRRLMQLTRFFADNYFRSVVIEEYEKLTDLNEPVILASNHSGMSFPWDNFVLFDLLLERCEGRLSITGLLAPILLDNPLLSPFALPDASYFFSAPATMKNFEELMQKRASVFINPEGIAGIGKGFNHRYELQPFSSSFIRMCIKYDRPLIPISIVNGEYLNPYAYSSRTLNKVLNLIGMPFLPLGPTIILCAIFPFVAYIALPARLHYVIGRRIDVKKMAAKPYEQMSVEEIKALTEQVRQIMQTNLDASVEKYGKVPYGWRSFLSSFRKLGWKSVALIPITWPFMVHKAYLGKEFTWPKAALSLLICVTLCLPIVGWPLLVLILFGKRALLKKARRQENHESATLHRLPTRDDQHADHPRRKSQ